MDALQKLLGTVDMFGEMQAKRQSQELDKIDDDLVRDEDREKVDAKITADSSNFLTNMMKNIPDQNTMNNNQPIENGAI